MPHNLLGTAVEGRRGLRPGARLDTALGLLLFYWGCCYFKRALRAAAMRADLGP
jgi:hypothetical protein